MTRPKSLRSIENIPEVTWFKPSGVQMRFLEEVSLTLDEIEAIRLADLEGEYQEKVAKKMNISRQTVGRILSSAHKKIAEALVLGKAIRMEGGQVQVRTEGPRFCGDGDERNHGSIGKRPTEASASTSTANDGGKIAVTAMGPELDSEVDVKFGRARFLIVIDLKNETTEVLDNLEAGDGGQMGIRTSKRVIDAGAGAVIAGNVGGKALQKLAESGIKIFLVDGGTVREAIDQYIKETKQSPDGIPSPEPVD
ncbi:MAG: DUF134 domain-containing protein [Proteobacteria bacterium]|nr:DUF134 domain-containing protein [Pseudomonadota bacterium]